MNDADVLVIAVRCGTCLQVTRVPTYGGVPVFDDCEGCGRVWADVGALQEQYRFWQTALEEYATVRHTLDTTYDVMAQAVALWKTAAGRHLLEAALHVEG